MGDGVRWDGKVEGKGRWKGSGGGGRCGGTGRAGFHVKLGDDGTV